MGTIQVYTLFCIKAALAKEDKIFQLKKKQKKNIRDVTGQHGLPKFAHCLLIIFFLSL